MRMLRLLLRNDTGAVALLFGLMLVPIVGLSAAAVDYSRASTARTELQAALDATALALARAPSNLNDEQFHKRAQDLFETNFQKRPDASFGAVNAVRDETSIHVEMAGTMETSLMRVLGIKTLPVAAAADVGWGARKTEVVLVLDNTGSMSSSGKMSALKSASRALLATLEQASYEPGAVRVGIVPFDTQVNIGTSFRSERWLYFDDAGKYLSPKIDSKNWTGCITDRNQPNDASDVAAKPGDLGTTYWAAKCAQAYANGNPKLAQLRPLTDDFAALRKTVDAMNPVGNTNITIGLAWGLAVLTRQEPLTEAAPAGDEDVLRFMLLLTDGDNTENRWTKNQTQIDARTSAACTSVKQAGIILYTVRVIEGNAKLLRSCATSPGMYYDVGDSSELTPVFESIAKQIAQLRLTR